MADSEFDTKMIVLLVLAFFLPPVAAYLKVGLDLMFWITLVLFFFMWFPGVLVAMYLVLTHPEDYVRIM